MKKIIAIIASALLLILLLSGCGYSKHGNHSDKSSERFETVYHDDYISVVIDNDTGVQYLCVNRHGITVLVDQNGNPIIYSDSKS